MKTGMLYNSIFCILWMLRGNQVSANSDWTITLTTHITEIVKPFQIIFFCNDIVKTQDTGIGDMIKRIGSAVPNRKLSFTNLTMHDNESLKFLNSIDNPRATTLFIIVDFPKHVHDLNQFRISVEFVIRIFPNRSRPKCLMVLSSKSNLGYKNLFRFMWSKKFLDATVLEINEDIKETMFLKKRKHDSDSYSVMTKLHYYNPFTQTVTEIKYASKTRLFPEKLNNLHGHEMKVGLYDSPPFSYVKRNSTGHPIETRGSDVLMSKVLSSKMNFKIILTPSKSANWGRFDCNRDKATGGFYSISHNEIQFISNLLGATGACKEQLSETTIVYDDVTYNALVPILPSTTASYLDPWKCALPIILIGLITFIVQVFERKLKFEYTSRQWHNILQPLLGFSRDETPLKLKERIVFGCLLITGMTYMSFIFSSLTEAMVQVESNIKMEDLHDLYQSGIIPVINEAVHKLLFNSTEGINHQILERSIKSSFSDQDCFEMLTAHKNVSCFMRLSTAQSILANSSKVGVAAILKQPVMSAMGVMWMEPATPYVDRFNEIIRLLVQSGLYAKWKNDFSINATFKIQPDYSDTVKLYSQGMLSQVLLFLITGYTVAFLVFLAELIRSSWIPFKRIWRRK